MIVLEGIWLFSLLVFLFFCMVLPIIWVLRSSIAKMRKTKVNIGDIVKWKHSFRDGEWLGGIVVDVDHNNVCYTIQPFHSANSRITLLADTYGEYWYKINKDALK